LPCFFDLCSVFWRREGGREGGIGNEKFGATTYLTFLIKY